MPADAGASDASETDTRGARWLVLHALAVLATGAATYLLPGGSPWFLTAPANLLLPLTLSCLLAALVCVRRRWFGVALLEGAGVLLALPVLGHDLAGLGRDAPSKQPALSIASFNLGVGLAEAEGVARELREQDVDLAVFLELTNGVAARLCRELGDELPHRTLYPGGVDGKGVFSRFPIVAEELFVLEQGRPYLRCRLDVDGTPVELIVVHLAPEVGLLGSASAAGRDLAAILDSRRGERTLIAGDFNSTWRSGVSERLRERGFREAHAESRSGPGLTFPVFGRYFGLPIGRFLRVDHIWAGEGLRPVWAWTGPDLGSDHLPIGAWFELDGDT